jgi:hypothetical protein
LADQQDSNDTRSPSEPPIIPLGSWCVAKIKRKLHERGAKHEKETPQDRFARRTANATVWIAILAVVAAGVGSLQYHTMQGQLSEMKSAGEQTNTLLEINKKLVDAALKQATAAENQVAEIHTQNVTTRAQIRANITP